jgi:hypothetical protein
MDSLRLTKVPVTPHSHVGPAVKKTVKKSKNSPSCGSLSAFGTRYQERMIIVKKHRTTHTSAFVANDKEIVAER